MTHGSRTSGSTRRLAAGTRAPRWLAAAVLAALGAGAGCETNDDVDIVAARNGATQDGQPAPETARRDVEPAPQADDDRPPPSQQAAQQPPGRRAGQQQAERSGSQQLAGAAAQQPRGDSGQGQAGDVSLQAAADVEDSVELGAFSPTTRRAEEDAQGRLPARGDQTIYVPNSSLFPGGARIDPGIENPLAGDPEAIAAGERHFNAFNCSGCHAPFGGGGMGPPLTDDQWIHGSEPAQIYLTIMHGRSEGMPAFGSMLPRRAVWELVTYVETLSQIDDYATHAGFDAQHATSVSLPGRFRNVETDQARNAQ